MLPDIDALRDSFDILSWDYELGDVLLFHGNILHSALGGVALDHPRRSCQAISDPLPLNDFDLKDGQSLGEFPEVFPVAWAP